MIVKTEVKCDHKTETEICVHRSLWKQITSYKSLQ